MESQVRYGRDYWLLIRYVAHLSLFDGAVNDDDVISKPKKDEDIGRRSGSDQVCVCECKLDEVPVKLKVADVWVGREGEILSEKRRKRRKGSLSPLVRRSTMFLGTVTLTSLQVIQ